MVESLGKKTVSGIIWSLIQRFGVMFVSFLTNVILARILTPDDFGTIGMLLIFLSVANTFVDGGFAAALIQKKNPSQEDYSTIFYWNLFVSVLLVGILYFCAPYIASFYKMPLLDSVLKVQSIILIINAFSIVQQNIFVKQLQFKRLAWVNLVANIVGATVSIILAYQNFGVWSLVYKNLISALGVVLIIWFISNWRPILVFDKKSFRSLGGFGIMVLFSNLVETIYTEIQGLIIGKVYSARDLGYYTQAKRLEEIPTVGLASAVNQVSFPIYSQLQDDYVALKNMLRKNIRFLAYINIPIFCVLILIAEPLIVLLFSDRWLESIPYFRILCTIGMIYPITSLNTNIIKSLGKGKLYFYLQLTKRGIGMIFLIIASKFGMHVFLWSLVFVTYLMYAINMFVVKKMLHYKYKEQLIDIIAPLFLSLFLLLLTHGVILLLGYHSTLWMILFALFYLVTYFCALLFLKVEVAYDFFLLLKSKCGIK